MLTFINRFSAPVVGLMYYDAEKWGIILDIFMSHTP